MRPWQWLRTDLGYKALSLLLAMLLWVFVVSEQNPMHVVERSLELKVINVPPGLVPVDVPSQVTVRFRASREILERLRWENLRAYIDAKGQTPGHHPLKVKVEVPERVQVLGVNPEVVMVAFDEWVRRTVLVEARITGIPASEYTYDPNPLVIPEQVTALGPSRDVVLVWRAVGEIDISGAAKDVEQQVLVWPVDSSGRRVNNVSLDPSSVRVKVSIAKKMSIRTVRISPRIEGQPKPGYLIGTVSVFPSTVSIQGEAGQVEGIEFLQTQPVSIEGATNTVEEEVDLELPRGVKIVGGTPSRARVKVEILAVSPLPPPPPSASEEEGRR